MTGKHTTTTRLAEHNTDESRCRTRQVDRLDSLPLHSGYLLDILVTPMYCGNSYICTPIGRNNHHTITTGSLLLFKHTYVRVSQLPAHDSCIRLGEVRITHFIPCAILTDLEGSKSFSNTFLSKRYNFISFFIDFIAYFTEIAACYTLS